MNATAPIPVPPVSAPCPRPGSNLYYSLAAVPPAQRDALRLWLTWWHETAQIPFKITDPGVAETKLRWWQQELTDAARGQAHHPLLVQLLAPGVVQPPSQRPPWPLWSRQLDGLVTLVHQTRWLDDGALQSHARMTTGAAFAGAACLLGAHSEAAQEAASELGRGVRLAHQLSRLGQDARAGWVQVAIEVLQAHDVKAHQLSKPDAAVVPAGWPKLLTHLHGQASDALRQGLDLCAALPPDQARTLLPLKVLAHLQWRLMDEVAARGDRVLHERIALTPLRKWWIAQRVRRGLLR